MLDGDLEIPESNREIALHLRAINSRLTGLENSFDEYKQEAKGRRFRIQDLLLSSLIFPIVGGILLFLLTQALG